MTARSLTLISLSLLAATWRLSFRSTPLELTSAALCRDFSHFLLGALIFAAFDRKTRWAAVSLLVSLSILEIVMFKLG